jgi:hypothetical protein
VTDQIKRSNTWRQPDPKSDPKFVKMLVKDRNYSTYLKEKRIKTGERMKIIVSGPVIERYRYQIPVKIGKRQKSIDPETGEILAGENRGDRKDEAKRTNSNRSRNEFRRLVLSNFGNMDKFVTLTFRDGAVEDVTNVRMCNKEFDKFIKRMRRAYGGFKYCRVIEFQDANGRGAVHYHCILTIPFVPWEELRETWGGGNIDITAIDHVDNVGSYVSKYMTKDLKDDRLAGVKAYATSQNMDRPVVHYGRAAERVNRQLDQKKEVFANSYESEYQGKIEYTEYNMNRG